MKRLKDNSDVPEARHGTLPKHIQIQRERQNYILFTRGGMGIPGCVNKRAGGKRVVGRFLRLYEYGQYKDTPPKWRL